MSDDDDDIDFTLISRLRATIISVTGDDDLTIPTHPSSASCADAEDACSADTEAKADEEGETLEDVGFTVEDWKAMEEEELKNMRAWQAEEEEEEEEEEEGEEEKEERDKGEEDAGRNVSEGSKALDMGDARSSGEYSRGLAGDDVDEDDPCEEDEGVEGAADERPCSPCSPSDNMREKPWNSSTIFSKGREEQSESGMIRLAESCGRNKQGDGEGEQGRGGEDDDAVDLESAGHRAASHDGGGEGKRVFESTGTHTERCAAGTPGMSRTPGMSKAAKV